MRLLRPEKKEETLGKKMKENKRKKERCNLFPWIIIFFISLVFSFHFSLFQRYVRSALERSERFLSFLRIKIEELNLGRSMIAYRIWRFF